MSEPFIGQLTLFPYNFVPKGWFLCDGSLLPIKTYSALFSLLLTNYGGDGTTTFGLPDLRGRVANGQGSMPSGATYPIGGTGGVENVTLSLTQMGSHSHAVPAFASAATTFNPANAPPAAASQPGRVPVPINLYAAINAGTPSTLAPQAIGLAGGNSPHNNMQPSLGLEWCIAYVGVYPSRP